MTDPRPAPPPTCPAGTRLATPQGPRPVERLAIGDVLLCADGTTATLRWLGRTVLFAPALAADPACWPVELAAGALGPGLPARPARVPPDQALEVPGHPPVAARWLVNGAGLLRPPPPPPLDLYRLDLDPPGTPLADGLPLAVADAAPPDPAALRALRRALWQRAGRAAGELLGAIDRASHASVDGWAHDRGTPDQPVAIELVVDGTPYPPVLADRPRRDLAAAGIADGRRSFSLPLNPPLDPTRPHLIQVRRALDGRDLRASPSLLAPPPDITALAGADPARLASAAEAVARRLAGP